MPDGPALTDAERLASLLNEIGWSHRRAAEILDVKLTSMLRWLNGVHRIPPELLDWLRLFADFHRQHPRPKGWRAGETPE